MIISHEQALRLAAHQRLLLEKANRIRPTDEVDRLLEISPTALQLLDAAAALNQGAMPLVSIQYPTNEVEGAQE